MNNTEIYIGKNTPVNKELLWIRPLNPGVSLYGNVNGKWEPLKLIDGKGTRTVEDDEVIDVANDIYSKDEIDERFADILGLDAEGIAELKALIEDGDALTGLLSEINNKADKTELENVAYTNVANRFTNANYFRHGDSDTAVLINNSGVSVHLASNQNQQWCHVEKDLIAFRNTTIGQIAFKPVLNNNVVRLAGGINNTDYKPLAYLEDVNGKQDTLVSGTNIKSINNNSILSSGNLKLCTEIIFCGKNDWEYVPNNNGAVDITDGITQYAEEKLSYLTLNTTSITANSNCYYVLSNTPSTLTISLPSITSDLNPGTVCAFYLTTGSNLTSITWKGGTRAFASSYNIEAGKTYEIIALYNGLKWLISATKFE